MAEVTRRLSFGDTTLHQPEFLDIHEVLQAASQPSIEQFQRALQQLETANYGRFVKLKEVAREQSGGCGESDLRRLKRQFASLKNTFMLYDVKQSFLEGLADGCPDGSEEAQLQETDEEVVKHGAEVKQQKDRNAKLQAEIRDLIVSISSTYKDFSQQKANITSHLECLASEIAQRDSNSNDELPDIGSGPDEVACNTLLTHEANQTRTLEAALAAQEAEANELVGAIKMDEEEIAALRSQIHELEMTKAADGTQAAASFADPADWFDRQSQLISLLSGVKVLAADAETLVLQLKTFPAPLPGADRKAQTHVLKLHTGQGELSADLEPPDVLIADIVSATLDGRKGIPFVVREVQARLNASTA